MAHFQEYLPIISTFLEESPLKPWGWLLDQTGCIVWLHHCIGDLWRWNHWEGLHNTWLLSVVSSWTHQRVHNHIKENVTVTGPRKACESILLLELPKGAKWFLKGANSPSLRVQTPPVGGCWYWLPTCGGWTSKKQPPSAEPNTIWILLPDLSTVAYHGSWDMV